MTRLPGPLRSERRAFTGLGVGAVTLLVLTPVLDRLRSHGDVSLTSVALLYLVAVVLVAVLGGVWPGIVAAVASDLLLNFFFVPPLHTLSVQHHDNLIALLVYVLVAVTVSVLVDVAAAQHAVAARSGVEAQLLSRIAAEPVVEHSLDRLLGHIRDTFGLRGVALVEEPDHVVARVGEAFDPDGATLAVPAADGLRLLATAPGVVGEDRALLARLAAAAARILEAQRLAERAAQASQLAEVDRLRTAILAAVGHDLRTPLAATKAAVSSLRAPDVTFTEPDRAELLATIEESTDRLDELVENLLAMSRLQAGVLSAQPRPVALDEVVARALLHSPGVPVEVGDDLPLVLADPGLLERVVANLVSNAVRAAGARVVVRAEPHDGQVRLHVVDHGPGVDPSDRDRIFDPFQRLHDRTADGGLGLGLAIARGFTEAMGGRLTPESTAGGGLTMTVELPVAYPRANPEGA